MKENNKPIDILNDILNKSRVIYRLYGDENRKHVYVNTSTALYILNKVCKSRLQGIKHLNSFINNYNVHNINNTKYFSIMIKDMAVTFNTVLTDNINK